MKFRSTALYSIARPLTSLFLSAGAIFVVMLLIGLFFVGRHGGGPIQGADTAIGTWFVHHRGPFVGVSKVIATDLDALPLGLLCAAVSVGLLLKVRSIVGLIPLVAYLGGEFEVFAIRQVILRHRPSTAVFPHPGSIPGIHETSYSFPSGHAVAVTAVVFAICSYLAMRRNLLWPYLLALFASAFVGYSRLILGVHWMSDIAGGLAAGMVWGIAVAHFLPRLELWRIVHVHVSEVPL